jgi:hypothetical protein
MATTVNPPPASAPPPPSAPPGSTGAGAGRPGTIPTSDFGAKIAEALGKIPLPASATTTTTESAPPADAAPQPKPGEIPTPSATEAQPGVGDKKPVAKSIDDIDLDAPVEQASAAASLDQSQPAAAVESGTPGDDPLALVQKVATDLGITPEVLTSSPTGRRLLSAQRYMDALSAPVEKGGLNYLPAVQEVQQAMEAAAAMDTLDYNFEASPGQVVTYFVAPDFDPSSGKWTMRPGALQFIDTLPKALKQLGTATFSNGQQISMFEYAARPFLEEAANQMYAIAGNADNFRNPDGTLNSENQSAYLQAARTFEASALRRDRMAKQPPVPDDVRQAREQIAAERRRQQEAQTRIADQNAANFSEAVLRVSAQRIESAVNRIMTETGAMNNMLAAGISPGAISALRDQIMEEAINLTSGDETQSISPSNPLLWQQWSRNFTRWTNQARFQELKHGVNQLAEQYYRLAQSNIRAAARRILSPQVEKAVQSNGVAHATAQAGAARIEPSGGPGSPKPQSVTANVPTERQPGEDQLAHFTRIIQAQVAQGAMQGRRV